MEKYGIVAHEAKPVLATAGAPLAAAAEEAVESEDGVEESFPGPAPEPVAAAQQAQGAGPVPTAASPAAQPSSAVPAASPSTGSQGQQPAQPSGQTTGQHAAPAPVLFGHSGSRKNKKHKRRHH
jgi:hypothetical protein